VWKDEDEMILVPAGPFWMGSETGRMDERPRHRVELDAYLIDAYEVTNTRYALFVEAGGYSTPSLWSPSGWAWKNRLHVSLPAHWANPMWNEPMQPVVGVSWFEAEAFCRYVGKRLPTEAEWEKAARGDDERAFPWGNEWDASRTNGPPDGSVTVRVGSYPTGVSPNGVHDMAGNVWEWVVDWYESDYYARSPERNPPGPPSGRARVLRGGAWGYSPVNLRASARYAAGPGTRSPDIGFRCARTQ